MATQLSKLHVRFIQTQKSFFLRQDTDAKAQKLPLSQLYVKDNSSFYLINQNDPILDELHTVLFKEPTDALISLQCDASVKEIDKRSDEFEDALLFFNMDSSSIKQMLLLNIKTLSDK